MPRDSWCIEHFIQYGTPYTVCSATLKSPGGFPCIHPPWTELVMVNISTGTQIWRSPAGYVPLPGFSRNWGSISQRGGVMETLGGLIFVSGTDDNNLWGFDATSGNQVFSAALPGSASGTPITFRIQDTQYIVLITINGSVGGTVMAWSLGAGQTLPDLTGFMGLEFWVLLCVIITVPVYCWYLLNH